MSATVEMMVPAGWRVVEPGDGPRSPAAVASEIVAHVPSESHDEWRREVESALNDAFAQSSREGAEVLSLLVPSEISGIVLPLTVAVLRLDLHTESSMEANHVLARIAMKDPTARLLATDAGPAMRTHLTVPLAGAEAQRFGLGDDDDALSLRARYLLPPHGAGRWLALVHTVPATDRDALSAWLELCDALVMGVSWAREE